MSSEVQLSLKSKGNASKPFKSITTKGTIYGRPTNSMEKTKKMAQDK